MEPRFETFIESMEFGTVRQSVIRAKSPTSRIFLVASYTVMHQVARIWNPTGEMSPTVSRSQIQFLMSTNELVVGTTSEGERDGLGLDLDRIASSARCRALYLSPIWLVMLSEAVLPAERRGQKGEFNARTPDLSR